MKNWTHGEMVAVMAAGSGRTVRLAGMDRVYPTETAAALILLRERFRLLSEGRSFVVRHYQTWDFLYAQRRLREARGWIPWSTDPSNLCSPWRMSMPPTIAGRALLWQWLDRKAAQ